MSTSKLAPAIATEAAPRGLHGQLRVRAERLGDRTRLVEVDPRPPLQVMAAHEVEPRVPDLASLTVVSPSGGILQGDRLEVDIDVGMRARLAVGTQSSVRVYRAPEVGACSRTTLRCDAGAYLEYLPDPWIPYAGSRLDALTRCVVEDSAALLVCEAMVAGRLARGERFDLDRFESRITVERPGGEPFVRDTLRIDASEPPGAIGRFGDVAAAATLLVVAPNIGPQLIRDAIGDDTRWGVSAMPDDAGVWVRVLGHDARSVMVVVLAARAAVRTALLGHPPIADRRP